MSAETVILKYMGAALPGNGAVVSIFDTTAAFVDADWSIGEYDSQQVSQS